MKKILSKKLVIGITGLAVLGGATGALAATQSSSSSGRQAYATELAKHLNVTPSALAAAVKATDIERIEAAFAAGRLTQAQANEAKQRIQKSAGIPLYGRGFGARGNRGHDGRGEATAATYLGISETALRSELKSGKSLAAIAASTPGKSVAGLQAAIVTAETTRLNAAVSSGKITAQQEQQRLADLPSHVEAMLQRTWSARANGGRAKGSSRY